MKLLGCLLLGTTLAIGGCAMQGSNRGEDEAKVHVQFGDLPPAVQKTFTAEAEGYHFTQVDKETDDGQMCYDADATLHGKNYEIHVAPDGTLLSKTVDDENRYGDHEDHDKGEDD